MEREQILAYMNDRFQRCQLNILNVVTREKRTLKTFDQVIEAPNWTPDGQALIYNRQGLIYRYDIETDSESIIDTGFADLCNNDHVLSPDGSELAISHMGEDDFESRIYILPIEGGTPRRVTANGGSYLHGWSPDNKKLTYCGVREGFDAIYSINLDGTEETRLTYNDGHDDGPEYSPDGKKIWYNSTKSGLMQIWKMNCDGSNQEQVTNQEMNCWFPHLSPNGQKVVYLAYRVDEVAPIDHPADKHVQLRIMQTDGSNDQLLIEFKGGQGTINVNSWSQDNEHIAYVSYE